MSRDQESKASTEQRVSDYLSRHKLDSNAFIAKILESEAKADTQELAKGEVEEGDIDEYLLKRAEAELRKAQARVDTIKKDMADKANWKNKV
jgi:hypothetical protein